MVWLLILVPVFLLIVFGVLYDYFVNKSFKESKDSVINQNVENARRDARTVEQGNFNGFGH
jgi:hypothetical protein